MTKRVSSFLFAILIVFFGISVSLWASESIDDGMGFEPIHTYKISEPFEDAPATFEVWLWMDTENERPNKSGYAVIGNYYFRRTPFINIRVSQSGVPFLEYYDAELDASATVEFVDGNLREGRWLHLAMVLDSESETVTCYINGSPLDYLPYVPHYESVMAEGYYIGGDGFSANGNVFDGKIRSVAIYSDVRTEEQINEDMEKVNTKDRNLLAYYEFSSETEKQDVKDKSKNKNDLEHLYGFYSEKDPVTGYAYSLAVVGDTQCLNYLYPEEFPKLYEWIVDNVEEKKISYVLGLGDITDDNSPPEWEVAKNGIFLMNGIVPYSLVRGNHDKTDLFNETFNVEEYTSMVAGLYQEDKIENSYHLFSAGDTDWLILTLDLHTPNDAVDWAAGVVEANPDRKVIITTHAFLEPDGDLDPHNNIPYLEENLVLKYENVVLMLNGHQQTDNITTVQKKGVNGNTVTYMLIDPQDNDGNYGPVGLVTMLYFMEDGDTVEVEYYSTIRNEYYKENNQFKFSLTGKDLTPDKEPAVNVTAIVCGVAGAVCVVTVIIAVISGKKKKIK